MNKQPPMHPRNNPAPSQVAEAAIDWFTLNRTSGLTDADRKSFDAWLAESPVHVREYLRIAELWGGLTAREEWPSQTSAELVETIRQASGNIVAHPGGIAPDEPVNRQPFHRRLTFAVAATVILSVTSVIVWKLIATPRHFETDRGEQRSLVLPDGSIVQLNTLSKLVVRFDKKMREVELIAGEAFFKVAQEANRPFEVITPLASVRAIGTEFNVYNHTHGTRVAVREGRVRVHAVGPVEPNAGAATLELNPDQAADVVARGTMKIVEPVSSKSAAENATAWIQRRIILDNDRIDNALSEFNRYNTLQIRVDNAALARLRINGGFDANEPAALIKYLEKFHGARAEAVDANLIVLH